MRFHFKLERILHFTRLREEMKKVEVAASMQRLEFAQRRKRDASQSISDALLRSRKDIVLWARYEDEKVRASLFQIKQLDKLIAEQNVECEKLRKDLSRISMRRRALEALREKREKEFRLDKARKDQKVLDEAHQLLRQMERLETQ